MAKTTLNQNQIKGMGAWTETTPTWTNLVVGTGGSAKNILNWTQIGKTVHFYGEVILGTTGASVSGIPTITLPVTASAGIVGTAVGMPIGTARITDTGTGGFVAYVDISSTTTARILAIGVGATYATVAATSSTVPMTWANTDIIVYNGTYEAA